MIPESKNSFAHRCSLEDCEAVILRLQQAAERNPRDWTLRYRLGICYSGKCHQHALVSPDLAVNYLRSTCNSLHKLEDPGSRAAILGLLALMYVSASALPLRARLLAAVECYEKSATIYYEREMFQQWARIQHNLGNTWCDMPDDSSAEKWEAAIAHYENALLFRTRQAQPVAFAATMLNLGTAYRLRITGEKSANLAKAMRCYRASLRLSSTTSAPARWAALHNNLGNVCLSLPACDTSHAVSHARHAMHHFDLALRVRTPERDLYDYAVTRFNRGEACFQLGRCGRFAFFWGAAQDLRDAHAAFLKTTAENSSTLAQKSLQLANEALRNLEKTHSATAHPA